MTMRPSITRGPARRTSPPRGWAKPPGLALLGLALAGLIQAGCRSDGCSTCGFGSKISSGVQALGDGVQALGSRVFQHHKGCGGGLGCGCGGGGGEEGMIVEPGIQVIPGGMALPAPGTIVPAPAIESAPTQLEAIPTNPSGGTGTGSSSNAGPASTRSTPGGNNRSAYTTMLPRAGTAQRRTPDVARALHSTPDRSSDAAGSGDLLDNIPPVDLPAEVTKKAAAPAIPAVPAPAAAPAIPAAATTPASTDNVTPTPAEKVSAAEGVTGTLPTSIAVATHQAPGIRRFASVAPAVGGGSAPSTEGLDWLKEKGYRTFIDLRRSSEVDPNFADAVNDRGMVYISLPIVADHLDPSRLARFDDLISRSDNRPMFFCDRDGTRAGLVWYIHVRTVDNEDSQAATGKAEEIGLTPAEVKLAEDYLASNKPRAKAAVAMATTSTPPTPAEPKDEAKPADPPAPAAPESNPAATQPEPTVLPPPVPSVPDEATPEMLPGEHKPQASNLAPVGPKVYRDPTAWRPLAALVLSGIGVPLAYWSRSVLSGFRSVRLRASLPGAKPRSLESRAGSDA